ncbi:glycosyltransferase [Luteimonas granuli]|uniref:Glycosyltransferase n=1 Tax=Luteimonas granuli TaxID=1176533 RepID=A0A518N205_9GAMM|nr:glycosyltransferase [Luteimonas granuli]QDW65929.1 glycosyltransferase [Luteimonas granuli]
MPRERLLLVIDGMEVGGSQRQIQHLLAGLDRTRWEPELAFFRCESFMVEDIRRSGVPVHYLPKRRRVDLRFLVAFARLLRRRDYALIHAYSLTAELWSMLGRGLSGRGPLLVASERSFDLDSRAWYWLLKRIVIAHSAAVIANSRAGAHSTTRRAHARADTVAIVGNAVAVPAPLSPDRRAALRRSLGAPEGRVIGLFVGRLVEAKNLPLLIAALATLGPGERPWIAFAGDGPLHASIEGLAAKAGVSGSIRLLGERRDAIRLMQAADFLVLPSNFEGQSNALLEAMAAGCPVIASAAGGTPELVDDGRTGLLFPVGDASALAAGIRRLVADPGLRDGLGRAAAAWVAQHHSSAALAAATSAVYERCLASRTGQETAPRRGRLVHAPQPPE